MEMPEHLVEKISKESKSESVIRDTYCDSSFTASNAFQKGASFGYQLAMDEQKELLDEVIKYCEPHLEQMWAARIVGIILNCDFRDCRSEIEKFKAQRGEK